MFRPMRRWKQQLSDEDCIAILKSELRGILSVLGDDGYPYGIPMNHWYCEADGKLYFHGAKTGHKIDAISQCDKVSYCVLLCRQCTGSRIAALLHQPQKQVLTSNIRVPELLRGVYRFFHGKDRLAGKTFCISHIAVPFCCVFTLYFF